MLRKRGHQFRVAHVRSLGEVGRLETLVGRRALLGVVHEQEVEESKPGLAQPRKRVLQVVVGLVLQGELLKKGQK